MSYMHKGDLFACRILVMRRDCHLLSPRAHVLLLLSALCKLTDIVNLNSTLCPSSSDGMYFQHKAAHYVQTPLCKQAVHEPGCQSMNTPGLFLLASPQLTSGVYVTFAAAA